ncbi:TPA: HNH endonuclease [Providencia rettgeri]|nr:HNH endonuclease [Providencia rettgeri]
MIENEFEYIEFLINSNLLRTTAYSYTRYLTSVSNQLEININKSTISSNQDIQDILNNRKLTIRYADSYLRNCGTALRRYLAFIQSELKEFHYPDELTNSNEYVEGAKKQIIVNSYERDREARNKAIEIHGISCRVCGMNFESVYGEIGIGFIHIHHLKPLYTIDEEYSVNPELDLVPVCPNCHAMLHRNKEMLSIEELKNLIQKNKNKL